MKTHLILLAAAAVLALSCCTHQNIGSVSSVSVQETLNAPKLAITPTNPGWLLEDSDIHPLTAAQKTQLRTLLVGAPVRNIKEKYYRSASQGNRGDDTDALFYLYGSNAQCLGGRVFPGRVMMDDLELPEETQKELYTLLKPQLEKVINPLP